MNRKKAENKKQVRKNKRHDNFKELSDQLHQDIMDRHERMMKNLKTKN